MYSIRDCSKTTQLYIHKPGQFYTRELVRKMTHETRSSNVLYKYKYTYRLAVKEIRNINHKYRPCYGGHNYDDYVLKVIEVECFNCLQTSAHSLFLKFLE